METFHLTIDYDEAAPHGSYKGIVLSARGGVEVRRWMTGDPQADWESYVSWALETGPRILMSSAVDHFLHDVPGWRMKENDLGIEMLVPEDRPEVLALEAKEARNP